MKKNALNQVVESNQDDSNTQDQDISDSPAIESPKSAKPYLLAFLNNKAKFKLNPTVKRLKLKNKIRFLRSPLKANNQVATDSSNNATKAATTKTSDSDQEAESQPDNSNLTSVLKLTKNLSSSNQKNLLKALISSLTSSQEENMDSQEDSQEESEQTSTNSSTKTDASSFEKCSLCARKFTSQGLFKNHLLLRHRLNYSKYLAFNSRKKHSDNQTNASLEPNKSVSQPEKLVNGVVSSDKLNSEIADKNPTCSCSEISKTLTHVTELFTKGMEMISSIQTAISNRKSSCFFEPDQDVKLKQKINSEENLNLSALIKLAKILSDNEKKNSETFADKT